MTDRAKAKCAGPSDCQAISLGHPSFEEIVTLDNLYQAFLCARSGKRERLAVSRFELNLGANLTALRRHRRGAEEILKDDYLSSQDLDDLKDIWETLHHIRQCRM